METTILNGWAASPDAWSLCDFPCKTRIFGYIDQLNGTADRFMRELRGKTILAGWSMGGLNALRLAADFPGKVAGLLLVAATPRLMEDKTDGWRGMSPRRLEALRAGLLMTGGRGLSGHDPAWPDPYMVDTPENLERGLDFLRTADVRHRLDEIPRDIPAYLFQSEADGVVRSQCVEFISTRLPQTRVRVVPGSEHALPLAMHTEISQCARRMLRGECTIPSPANDPVPGWRTLTGSDTPERRILAACTVSAKDLAAHLARGGRATLFMRHAQRPHLSESDPTFGERLPITAAGREAARALGARLAAAGAPAPAFYSSPLARCRATAQAIAEGMGRPSAKIAEDPALGLQTPYFQNQQTVWRAILKRGFWPMMEEYLRTGTGEGFAPISPATEKMDALLAEYSRGGFAIAVSHDSHIAAYMTAHHSGGEWCARQWIGFADSAAALFSPEGRFERAAYLPAAELPAS